MSAALVCQRLRRGWLIESVSWRAVFFINLPLAVLVILISLRNIDETGDKDSARVDWLGTILAALGLGALVYGLIESSRLGFEDRSVLLTLIAAVALIALFLVVESRSRHPMLPLTLFRSRTFTGTNVLTFLLYGALGGTLFFLPLNLIQVQHYSATAAGGAMLPFVLIIALLSRWSGGLVTAYGAKAPLIIGPLVAASGFALFIRTGIGGSYWAYFFPPIAVLGLGMAISVAPLTTAVMNSVARGQVGIASGVNNAVARSAGLLAIAVLGLAMLHVFNAGLDRRVADWKLPPAALQSLQAQRPKLAAVDLPTDQDPAVQTLMRRAVEESFVSAFRIIMGIGAGLSLVSAAVAMTLIKVR